MRLYEGYCIQPSFLYHKGVYVGDKRVTWGAMAVAVSLDFRKATTATYSTALNDDYHKEYDCLLQGILFCRGWV